MNANTSDVSLPEFRSHGFDSKFRPLEERHFTATPSTAQFVRFLEAWASRPLGELTVLDVGCGRGDLVAALRAQGVRAFGIEIDARFVESGRLLEAKFAEDYPILSVIQDGRSVFPDEHFDLIVSDQVMEHVADLNGFASEVARLLKPEGQTVHLFPARFRPVEPHYFLPVVHWLPKNGLRRFAIKALLALGLSRQFFPQHDLTSRAEIIFRYSLEETFYRPVAEISSAFAAHGIRSSFGAGMKTFVSSKLRVPKLLAAVACPLVAGFKFVVFTGAKRP